MTPEDIFWMALPALLIAGGLIALRVRREFGAQADESSWTGTGFNSQRVARRLRRLRSDYVAEARSRPAHTCRRRAALAAARQGLTGRSFFRHAPAEEGPEDEPPPRG